MSDGIYKAVGYLIVAFFLYVFYVTAKEYGKKSTNFVKSLFTGLIVAAIIAFFANSMLGTHSENCDDDPVYGRCDTVQDYNPTPKQYRDNLFFWLLLTVTPITIGLYKGKKEKLKEY